MFGGAVYCYNCYELAFKTPAFNSNTAYRGGSMYLDYATNTAFSAVTLNMSMFNISSSQSASDGGFFYFNGANTDLTMAIMDTTFSNIASSTADEIENIGSNVVGGGFAFIKAK
jgi:expansin (peptidoglycan-binding protein)